MIRPVMMLAVKSQTNKIYDSVNIWKYRDLYHLILPLNLDHKGRGYNRFQNSTLRPSNGTFSITIWLIYSNADLECVAKRIKTEETPKQQQIQWTLPL